MKSMFSYILVLSALCAPLALGETAQASSEYRVRARVRTGTPVEAKGDYRERLRGSTLVQRFTVEVNRATPGESFEVKLNGSVVATVVANALGNAKVEFNDDVIDDNPTDNQPPLPDNFPHINAGDTLQIGTFPAATFARR